MCLLLHIIYIVYERSVCEFYGGFGVTGLGNSRGGDAKDGNSKGGFVCVHLFVGRGAVELGAP